MQVPTAQPITAGGVTQPLGDSWSAGDPWWGLTQVVFAWVLCRTGKRASPRRGFPVLSPPDGQVKETPVSQHHLASGQVLC